MFGVVKTEMSTDMSTTSEEESVALTLRVWTVDEGVNAVSPHVAIDVGYVLNYSVIIYKLRRW